MHGVNATQAREFLRFVVGDACYGIDLQKVQELHEGDRVARHGVSGDTPSVPTLGGVWVPVRDLRARLGVAGEPADAAMAVVVLRLAQRVIGVLVDDVLGIATLAPSQIQPPPRLGFVQEAMDHVIGLGMVDGQQLILLDPEALAARDVTPMSPAR